MTAITWVVTGSLFACGAAVVVMRRQLLAMLLGLELMLCAVNLAIVHHAGLFGDAEALAAVILVMAVAAAEAVVGLSLVLQVQRLGRGTDSTAIAELRG